MISDQNASQCELEVRDLLNFYHKFYLDRTGSNDNKNYGEGSDDTFSQEVDLYNKQLMHLGKVLVAMLQIYTSSQTLVRVEMKFDDSDLDAVNPSLLIVIIDQLIQLVIRYSISEEKLVLSSKRVDGEVRFSISGISASAYQRLADKCTISDSGCAESRVLRTCYDMLNFHQGLLWSIYQHDQSASILFSLPVVDLQPV